MSDQTARRKRAITSEGLTNRTIIACWAVSVLLLGCGITATFVAGTGPAPASMILFGSLFLFLALMRRVPLSLEVGGAKFDASYQVDEAYDAGRDIGRQLGVEDALTDVSEAKARGESPDEALQALRERLVGVQPDREEKRSGSATGSVSRRGRAHGQATDEVGYRGPTACNAAGITYRQLDYWARTGLVEPSLRGGSGRQRLYSHHDILMLRVIKRLLDAGVSLQQIRTVILHLRDRESRELEQVTLMSDGDSIYEATSKDEVVDLLDSGEGMFGIAIGPLNRDLLSVLRELPGKRGHAGSDGER
ncbi:hypothetical protein GCM10009737_10080 [Nocardioides lentus]|uniref:HTH merR-type domain-containing protein n=1 Tax=Nocardioides lentus TaxID=338077 RepID=A0ABN2P2Y8_9ACTN